MENIIVENYLGRKKISFPMGIDGNNSDEITLPVGVWNYGAIISSLIRAKYSENDMEAIINNSLALISTPSTVSDEKAEQRQAELQEMLEWREKCKTRAKELLEIGTEMGLVATDVPSTDGE